MAGKTIIRMLSCTMILSCLSVFTVNAESNETIQDELIRIPEGLTDSEMNNPEADKEDYRYVNLTDEPAEASSEGDAYAVVTDEGELIFFRSNDNYTDLSTGSFTDIEGNSYTGTVYANIESTDIQPWADKAADIRTVHVAADQTVRPVSTSKWFRSCAGLTDIDLNGLDTSDVIDMSYMFYGCKGLSELDVSSFITSKVKNFNSMFNGCSSLKSMDLSSFDTSSAERMADLFMHCTSLESVNLSSFNTSNVLRMGSMFYKCTSLTDINLSNFDTAKVESFYEMFGHCTSLKHLDISSFDTSSCKEMLYMFLNCSELTSLDLSHFNTSSVGPMYNMFDGCRNLRILDISGFSTSSMTSMEHFFRNCDRLYCVKLGSGFTRWADSSYLPAGTWTNNEIGISLSAEQLYQQYPAHASEWAGTWTTTRVWFSSKEYTMVSGTKMVLIAHTEPEDDGSLAITYKSSDSSVISLEDNLAEALNAGKATITATADNGAYGTCVINVLFKDVADDSRYYFEPVYWALENGITVGAGGVGKFSPDNPCTREQIVTFLWRLKHEPEPVTPCEFTDVTEDAWYFSPISWAYENGITTGLNDGTGRFGVGQPCTREQCVTFLYRAAGEPEVTEHIEFTDVTEDRYFYDAISWAASKGITVGLNDGTGRFGVGQKCTRAMIVTFLYRYAHTS